MLRLLFSLDKLIFASAVWIVTSAVSIEFICVARSIWKCTRFVDCMPFFSQNQHSINITKFIVHETHLASIHSTCTIFSVATREKRAIFIFMCEANMSLNRNLVWLKPFWRMHFPHTTCCGVARDLIADRKIGKFGKTGALFYFHHEFTIFYR